MAKKRVRSQRDKDVGMNSLDKRTGVKVHDTSLQQVLTLADLDTQPEHHPHVRTAANR